MPTQCGLGGDLDRVNGLRELYQSPLAGQAGQGPQSPAVRVHRGCPRSSPRPLVDAAQHSGLWWCDHPTHGGPDQPFTKWKDTAMERTASRYPEPTASTQADTEATQLGASVSFIRAVTGRPACSSATARRLDWVPDREWADVPEEIAAICSSCPLQKACLRWATDHDEPGYWGGTTRAQRAAGITLESLEQVRAQRRVEEAAKCLHSEAEGPSMEWYRRGCPCRGCKAANAARAARYKRARQARHQLSVAS
jgi:hypothetical protein